MDYSINRSFLILLLILILRGSASSQIEFDRIFPTPQELPRTDFVISSRSLKIYSVPVVSQLLPFSNVCAFTLHLEDIKEAIESQIPQIFFQFENINIHVSTDSSSAIISQKLIVKRLGSPLRIATLFTAFKETKTHTGSLNLISVTESGDEEESARELKGYLNKYFPIGSTGKLQINAEKMGIKISSESLLTLDSGSEDKGWFEGYIVLTIHFPFAGSLKESFGHGIVENKSWEENVAKREEVMESQGVIMRQRTNIENSGFSLIMKRKCRLELERDSSNSKNHKIAIIREYFESDTDEKVDNFMLELKLTLEQEKIIIFKKFSWDLRSYWAPVIAKVSKSTESYQRMVQEQFRDAYEIFSENGAFYKGLKQKGAVSHFQTVAILSAVVCVTMCVVGQMLKR